ncbi:hypothetical protein E4U36_008231 [Claviceps purpurea]|nr:hypothetical protein E4U36_008231 [Claviceps purpurea]
MDLAEAVEAQREQRLKCREEVRVITGALAESGRARPWRRREGGGGGSGGGGVAASGWWEVEVEEEEEGDASEALGSPGIRDVETQPKLAAIGRE